MMVAMNTADLGQGRRLDRSRAAICLRFDQADPTSKFRADINVIGVPLTASPNSTYTDPRQRQLFQEHHLSWRLCALLDLDPKLVEH